jgi:hypothetical protein
MKRSFVFALPLLSFLVACGDPIVGTWTLQPTQVQGQAQDGSEVLLDATGELDVQGSLESSFVLDIALEGTSVQTLTYTGSTSTTDNGYSIDMTTEGGALNLLCTLTEDDLSCSDTANSYLTLDFSRAE